MKFNRFSCWDLLTVVGHSELLKRLGAQQVLWIRECDETLAASLPVAVTRIEILRAYPDLEADDIREALTYAAEAMRERTLPLRDVA